MKTRKTLATFSIVAFDPETDSLGVAVQSKFLAVGSVVPWARPRRWRTTTTVRVAST
jgi:uncharacterized Ntn-hydrolase superfamily protein